MNAIAQMVKQSEVAATIVKADKKADEAKKTERKARSTRTAQKPVEKKESAVVKATKVLPVKFEMPDGVKPSRGARLYAFTAAWMEVLGMFKGTAYAREVLESQALGGKTMVNYHLGQGNLETCKEGVRVSAQGRNRFTHDADGRAFDQKDKDAYIAMIKTGKADGRLVKDDSKLKACTVKA